MKTENLSADNLHPQSYRGLINRDKSGRIEGVVKEVAPAGHHAPNARGIILITPTVLSQMPQTQCGSH